jgi:hypothetical protein
MKSSIVRIILESTRGCSCVPLEAGSKVLEPDFAARLRRLKKTRSVLD